MNYRKLTDARQAAAVTVALALFCLGRPAAAAHDDGGYAGDASGSAGSYGYVRVVDGHATLFAAGSGARSEAGPTQPILIGDRLWIAPGDRAEVVLSDRNRLRLGGDAEVTFDALAGSPDGDDPTTVLRLAAGDVQLVVVADALGETFPRLDTPNATVYVREAGSYRVSAERAGWTSVVVRSGFAEVLTRRGSLVVRSGEQALVEGDEWASTDIRAAGPEDPLERWGRRLDERLARSDVRYLDESLRYDAADLGDYGEWIYVERRPAWRPHVTVGWRPYYHGRWFYTPSGLTWVSNEPWGWVPYHYGSWDYVPHYGWVWYPGSLYSPAWVYWYWGPSYVAWCPIGYYTNYYYPRYRRGFHFGIYGYAGGHVDAFFHWNYIRTPQLAYRDQARYVRPGRDLRGELGGDRVPRGIITADTRPLGQEVLSRPTEAVNALHTRPLQLADGRGGRELPDVSRFIARGELGAEETRAVLAERPLAQTAVATPMRPEVRPVGAEGSRRLERRPLAVPQATSGGESPRLERRPTAVPERDAGGGGPRLERRPTAAGQATSGGESPRLERRPARSDAARESAGPGEVRIERRPATRPQAPPPAASSEVRIERRPATRPQAPPPAESRGVRIERRPVEVAPEPSRRPAAPTVERRPAPRPQAPAAGSSGVRIERRPAPRPQAPPAVGSSGVRIERRPAPRPQAAPPASSGRLQTRPAPGRSAPSGATPSPTLGRRPGSRPSVTAPPAASRPAPRVSPSPAPSPRPGAARAPTRPQRPASPPPGGSSARSGGGRSAPPAGARASGGRSSGAASSRRGSGGRAKSSRGASQDSDG